MVFDGREFARKIIEKLKRLEIRNKKLVVFYNPEDKPSRIYTNIKEKVATEIGVDFVKISIIKSQIPNEAQIQRIKLQIEKLNINKSVDGILVQLPLGFGDGDLEIVRAIAREKDVDGLREDSLFMPAVVRAVFSVLSAQCSVLRDKKICVIGCNGFVGRKLMQVFPDAVGMDKEDFDPERSRRADVVISCTGRAGLIKQGMVKDGVVAIDIGYPKGDFDPEVAKKASFFTSVPGGVGPVTVAMLFANLADAAVEAIVES